MNTQLIFDSSIYEDNAKLELINNVDAMYNALFEIKNNFKRSFKHRDLTEKEDKLLDEVLEKLYELTKDIHLPLNGI